ncbi:MAG: IS1634 family transposase [Actinobacteria bacterium]|nr:IS1634 family transposase [Actinomycetota bacterium]
MFVKTTVRRRGDKEYRYLSLVEAVRVEGKNTHRTLLRLGEVSELAASGQLDRIIDALSAHAKGTWLSAVELEATDAPALGAMAAVHAYWRRLGLDAHFSALGEARGAEHLDDTVFAMVANRLLAPCSKRALPEWLGADVVAPEEMMVPSVDQCYRALDAVAEAKEATENHLYAALTDLTNLDLRLVCYDLTSTYFEGERRPSERFASRAFGYSRDHRGDRPQIVIGLLVTSDGIPIAHHVFAGNTADVSTLPGVLDDLKARFGVGGITMVADRGLISEDNVRALSEKGFGHILATRLHRDHDVAAVLEASTRPEASWEPCPEANSAVCELSHEGRRYVVVASSERHHRDAVRTAELVERTSAELRTLEMRVRDGRLRDKAKIGQAAGRILARSGVARLFDCEIDEGHFLYHYDEVALDYEEQLLAGRYVLATSLSLSQASAPEVLRAYRRLLEVESTFRVLKNFIALRPVYHWTEARVRAHVAVCVLGLVIEALIEADLRRSDVRDPDLPDQVLSPRRVLRELGRIRAATIVAGDRRIDVVTRRSPLQARVLAALGVDTSAWDRAKVR